MKRRSRLLAGSMSAAMLVSGCNVVSRGSEPRPSPSNSRPNTIQECGSFDSVYSESYALFLNGPEKGKPADENRKQDIIARTVNEALKRYVTVKDWNDGTGARFVLIDAHIPSEISGNPAHNISVRTSYRAEAQRVHDEITKDITDGLGGTPPPDVKIEAQEKYEPGKNMPSFSTDIGYIALTVQGQFCPNKPNQQ